MITVAESETLTAFARHRLAANSSMGAIRFLFITGIYILLYPFLLKSLGPSRFGLWALLCIPSQYLALGDLGLSNALIKLVAEVSPKEGVERLKRLSGSTSVIFAIFGITLTLGVFVCQNGILRWLRIDSSLLGDARVLLLGTVCVVWLLLHGNVYVADLSGLHRVDLAHVTQMCGTAVNAAGMFVAIELGWGLVGILLSNAVSAVVTWLLAVLLVRRATDVRFTLYPNLDRESIRALLGFGSYLYIAALSALLMDPTVRVLLTRYIGLASVTYFEIASRIVSQTRSFFAFVMMPLLPASSILMRDPLALRHLFGRAMRFLSVTALPTFLIIAELAKPIIHAWFGREMPLAEAAMAILAIGWLLNTLSLPSFFFVQGLNDPRSAMWCAVSQGVLCVTGTFVFLPRVGFYGGVCAEATGLGVASTYIFLRFLRATPMGFADIFGNSAQKMVCLVAGLAVGLFLASQVFRLLPVLIFLTMAIIAVGGYITALFRRKTNGFNALELIADYLPMRLLKRREPSSVNYGE